MNVDLERSLAQLAESVHDDATTDRMAGQVRHMVSRIRRRRAARHTATGMVSVGAVAGVAFGGVQLADRLGDGPGPGPTIEPADDSFTQCGAVAEDPNPAVSWVVSLDVRTGTADTAGSRPQSLPVAVSLGGETGEVVAVHGDPQVVVTRDRVVVSEPAVLEGVMDTEPPVWTFDQDFTSCDPQSAGEPLPAGDYEIVALQTVEFGVDGPVELFGTTELTLDEPPNDEGEPAPTETTEPDASADPDEGASSGDVTASQEALAALLAAPSGTVPSCGSSMDTRDDGQPPLVLDLALPERVYAPGERIEQTATLRTTEGRHVIGNASASGAKLLLVKDGVIVGTVYQDPEDVDLVDLGPQDSMEVALTGVMQLCSVPMTEGEMLPLPPGTYQAFAVMDVMLKEIQEANGEAVSSSELLPVLSNAVRDVVVGTP